MTSLYEGFPMVLVEVSSYGVPLVSFDINTGPSDIIENKKSGFLIEDGNFQEFADKIYFMQDLVLLYIIYVKNINYSL